MYVVESAKSSGVIMTRDGQAAPKSRRERPAKPALSLDAIVDAAVAVLDRDGIEAVTMRRIAQELDTGPASLYVYVSNRQHLLDLVYDRIMVEVAVPADGDWRDRLSALLEMGVETLSSRRGLATVTMGNVPTGPNALAVSEQVMSLLREGGMDDRSIAWAVDLLGLVVTGLAAEADAFAERSAAESVSAMFERVDQAFAAKSAEQFPILTDLRPLLLSGTANERLLWFIQVLLNGLAATPPPVAGPSTALAPDALGNPT